MANVAAAYGFREFRRLDGSPPTGGMETLTIAASDPGPVFTGDPVVTGATGPYVTQCSSVGSAQTRGIFKGCEYYSPAVARKVWSPYYPGSIGTTLTTGDVQAWVITDPDMLFTVQGGIGGNNTTINASNVGLNYGWSSGISSQGNTTTGISILTLLSTSVATTNTLPFRLFDLLSNWAPPGQNGLDNTTAGNFVIVAPNNWDRKQLTAV